MWSIAKHESIELLKSIKSILVLLFLLGSTYAGVKVTDFLKDTLDMSSETGLLIFENEAIIYSIGLSFAVLIFGPLFAFILSHDVINRDIEQRTMRFLVTKTSRKNIVLGKLMGHLLFWITILTVASGLVFVLSKQFSFYLFFQSLSFLFIFVTLALLLSLFVTKPILSSFISILLGITIPIVSLWAIFSDKWYIAIFKYVSPYYYLQEETMIFLVNFAFASIYGLLAIYLFEKRDV